MKGLKGLAFILVFALGLAGGWLLHDVVNPEVKTGAVVYESPRETEPPPTLRHLYEQGYYFKVVVRSEGNPAVIHGLIGDAYTPSAGALLEQYMSYYGDYFDGLTRLARIKSALGYFEAALSLMEKADLLIRTEREQILFSRFLGNITNDYARDLMEANNFAAVDELYERITLAMPEEAGYYLKLGLLRIRLGNYDAALVPLSQIENHAQLGEEARELIAQTEVDERLGSLEVLPLLKNGAQFIVEALVDGQFPIKLLVDTGAAMTIIDESALQSMGYDLSGRQQGLFSTANGVVEAPVVSINALSLGSASIGPIAVGGLPLSMHSEIGGLLGMNFLRHYDFRIDQTNKELHLMSER